jgi:copper chaperone
VIADEIHSTGRADEEGGLAVEATLELLQDALAQLVAHRRICFIDTDNEHMESLKLTIEGMSCEHCVRAVKNRLTATPGVAVEEVEIGSAKLHYDPARTNVDEIEEAIADEGYTAFVAD